MTEINQLERVKLAHEHGLRVEIQYKDKSWNLMEINNPSWDGEAYRVHPHDEAKLDAIIWEGADADEVYARINTFGEISHFMNPVSASGDLIATRELPAEKLKPCPQCNSDDVAFCNISVRPHCNACKYWASANHGTKQEAVEKWNSRDDELPAEKPEKSGLVKEISYEDGVLFADLKEFAGEAKVFIGALPTTRSGRALNKKAKALLERINPKPVRSSADLPVDTLCEVWCEDDILYRKFSTPTGFSDFPTVLGCHSYNMKKFKALEQPQPTFWQGGECPVPDWVSAEIFYRSGNVIKRVNSTHNLSWKHTGERYDIIAYRILGEVG